MNKKHKIQKPIDLVIKETAIKEEARQKLKQRQDFEHMWRKFYPPKPKED